MRQFPAYWTDVLRINYMQRCVVLHSYLYYELDNPVISDREFDRLCKKLCEYQGNYEIEWLIDNTNYGYCLYDFDGTTGFDIWERLRDEDKKKIMFVSKGVGNV